MSYKSPKWNNGSAPPLSAENMQALTDAVQEQGETLATMCNPNMLDNWYFGNPINQRGQTSYTGGVYGIDRWLKSAAETTVAVVTGGISASGKQFQRLEQRVEDAQSLNGITVTFSALVKNPNGNFRLALYNATTGGLITQDFQASEDFQLVQITAAPVINAGDVFSVALYPGANNATTERTCLIKAVKLELGSQQTLAHQENGAWVLNEIPKFGDQLAACQRCAVRLSKWSQIRAASIEQNTIDFSVPIPTSMRAVPVLVDVSKFIVRTVSGNAQDGFSLTTLGGSESVVLVRATKTSHGLADAQLYIEDGAMFSADL
jgi:hypothetical protein